LALASVRAADTKRGGMPDGGRIAHLRAGHHQDGC